MSMLCGITHVILLKCKNVYDSDKTYCVLECCKIAIYSNPTDKYLYMYKQY